MGKQNRTKGECIGKLGTHYGVKQHGKAFEKVIPFSHTPHNTAQKNAFTAFGKLQRFSSGLEKVFWQYMGLSDKKMTRLNATSQFFKKAIANGYFDISKCIEDIPLSPSGESAIGFFDKENNSIQATITNTIDGKFDNSYKTAFIAIDTNGYVHAKKLIEQEQEYINIYIPLTPTSNLIYITVTSRIFNKKRQLVQLKYETVQIA